MIRKRIVGRILSFILALVLVCSVIGTLGMTSNAEEADIQVDDGDIYTPPAEEHEDVPDPLGVPDTPPGPIVGEGYKLVTKTPNISFGNIIQGSTVEYLPVPITNNSTRAVMLYWVESDPEQCLTVDAPQDNYVEVGQTATFYVKPNTTVGVGNHTALLIVGDTSDISLKDGVSIRFSFNVTANEPHIDSVSITPESVSAATGSVQKFKAIVRGENNPNTAVTWSISGQTASDTYMDNDGCLNVSPNEKAKNIQVKATSVQDSSFYAIANVTIIDTDHSISVIADPVDGGSVSGGGIVAGGGSFTVLAAPNITYRFAGWYYNGSLVSNQAKYTQTNINSDITLVAKFIKEDHYVSIKTNHPEAGEVTASQFVNDGGSLVLQASARKGWQFEGWQENGNYISKDVKFNLSNIRGNREIRAIFSQNQYEITLGVNPSDCGKVTGAGKYQKGFDVKIKAEPYEGYVFKNWTYNGNVVSNDAEFTVKRITQDYYIVANFEKKGVKNYKITAGVCSNDGVISPSGESRVQEGGSMLYTITPKSGYRVLAVAVDGVQVGAVNSYTFTNVKGNHSIAAAFTPIEQNQVKPATNTNQTAKTPTDKKNTSSGTTTKEVHKSETDTITPKEALDPDAQLLVDDISEGVKDEGDGYDYDSQEGVVQELNLTLEEAVDVNSDTFQDVMYSAIRSGALQVAIFDEYDHAGATAALGDFINSTALPNLENVVDSILTEEDINDIVTGNPVKINVNIFNNTNFISEADKLAIDSYTERGVKIGNYFEMLLMKSKNGNCESITETSVGMKVCMDIPADLLSDGRAFYIIRSHELADGTREVAILYDEDNNPNTVTFTTDRFSSYAIAYQGGKNTDYSRIVMIILVGAVAVLALIISVVVGTSVAGRKHSKRR